MNDKNKKDDTFELIEIFEKVTIIYNDNNRELFDAIYINDFGIYTGKVLKKHNDEVFIEEGGIPKNNIKHIKWDIKKTVLKSKF